MNAMDLSKRIDLKSVRRAASSGLNSDLVNLIVKICLLSDRDFGN